MSVVYQELIQLGVELDGKGALLGLDLGTRTIGLAISDERRSIASPLASIRRTGLSNDIGKLNQATSGRTILGVVLGLPRSMDGSEGPRCQSTRTFARNLANMTSFPVSFWDERLSTVEAERTMIAAGLSRARRRRSIDQVAASIILQGALDFLANRRGLN